MNPLPRVICTPFLGHNPSLKRTRKCIRVQWPLNATGNTLTKYILVERNRSIFTETSGEYQKKERVRSCLRKGEC